MYVVVCHIKLLLANYNSGRHACDVLPLLLLALHKLWPFRQSHCTNSLQAAQDYALQLAGNQWRNEKRFVLDLPNTAYLESAEGLNQGNWKKTHPTMHPLTLQPSPATNDFRGQNCNSRNTNFKSFPISGHPWANRTTRLSTFFASIAFRRYKAWMYEYDWVILIM